MWPAIRGHAIAAAVFLVTSTAATLSLTGAARYVIDRGFSTAAFVAAVLVAVGLAVATGAALLLRHPAGRARHRRPAPRPLPPCADAGRGLLPQDTHGRGAVAADHRHRPGGERVGRHRLAGAAQPPHPDRLAEPPVPGQPQADAGGAGDRALRDPAAVRGRAAGAHVVGQGAGPFRRRRRLRRRDAGPTGDGSGLRPRAQRRSPLRRCGGAGAFSASQAREPARGGS